MRDYFKELYGDDDEYEDEDEIIQDGERICVGMKFADGSSVSRDEVLAHFRDHRRDKTLDWRLTRVASLADDEQKLADEKAAYDDRIFNAWRDAGQTAHTATSPRDEKITNLADEKAAYDERLRNAWRRA